MKKQDKKMYATLLILFIIQTIIIIAILLNSMGVL